MILQNANADNRNQDAFAAEKSDPNLYKPIDNETDNRLNTQRGAQVKAPEGMAELVVEYDQILSKFNMPFYRKHPKLCEFVATAKFETLMAFPILFNCFTIGMAANCTNGCQPSQHWCSECSEATNVFLLVTEHLLTLVFVTEFGVRIAVFGPTWVKEPFNMFDTALVFITGVLVVWILEPAGVAPAQMRSVQVMRSFRLMRLSRVVKSVPEFKEMWLLVQGLSESAGTLFWSICLILFLLYIFGITATEIIGGDTDAWDLSNEEDYYLHSLWSNIPRSMFTLIQFMTLDSWTGVARPMMERQPYIWIFFLVFIAIATFVLLNLVTAVIVNSALDINKRDEEAALEALENEKKEEFKKLSDLFHDLDADGSGSVDREEFETAFELPAVRNKLRVLDFEESELLQLFDLIDKDGGGELALDEFLYGLKQLKGNARSKDLMALQSNLGRCMKQLSALTGRREDDPISQKPKLNLYKLAPGNFQEVGDQLEMLEHQVSGMEYRFMPVEKEEEGQAEAEVEAEDPSEEDFGPSSKERNGGKESIGNMVFTDPDVQVLANSMVHFKKWSQGVNSQLERLVDSLNAIAEDDQAARALVKFAGAGRQVQKSLSAMDGFRAGTAPEKESADFSLPGSMPPNNDRPVTSPEPHAQFAAHTPKFSELRQAAQAAGHEHALMQLEPNEVLV